MIKQKIVLLAAMIVLFPSCNSSWKNINEEKALEIRERILANHDISENITITKKYSRVEKYNYSKKEHSFDGVRLQVSKSNYYIKDVIFEPTDWLEEPPFYIETTQYHIIKDKSVWVLTDNAGKRKKSETKFDTVEEAQKDILNIIETYQKYDLEVNFDFDLRYIKRIEEYVARHPDQYSGEHTFKSKDNDDKTLEFSYKFTQPKEREEPMGKWALRESHSTTWENGHVTHEKGHYEGFDYNELGYGYDYVEDVEYKGNYSDKVVLDQVDPDTWCE